MMMRSMPPASAHLALMPVPAPPPMIALPAATWARRRWRHSSRLNKLIGPPSLPGGGAVTIEVARMFGRLYNSRPVLQQPRRAMAVLLIGTLDTKGLECQFVRDLLTAAGVSTRVIDAGVV